MTAFAPRISVGGFTRKWALARFFYVNSSTKTSSEMLNNALQIEIEQRLSAPLPGIDVLLVEQSGDVLRVYIDHPDGVSLGLCEQVTHELGDLRERYALEVSSPGPRRPLTKPEHFRRFVGRRARVRAACGETGAPDREAKAYRNLTGELVAASADAVTIAAAEGVVAIPYSAIQRSHLVEE